MKFAILLKGSQFLTVSIVFSVYKQNFTAQKLEQLQMLKFQCLLFVIEAIIYLLLYNLHDCTFNTKTLNSVKLTFS